MPGANGQDGVVATDRATAGTISIALGAASGGRSGGGSVADGEAGGMISASGGNGGGGGGGVGCVVVRTASGVLPVNAELGAPSTAPALTALVVRSD